MASRKTANSPATQRRRLASGKGPWRLARLRLADAGVPQHVTWDAVIVGAGISGALIADALVDAGLNVLMIDRRGVARGSTAASTALLLYELDDPMGVLQRRLGWPATQQAWFRSRLAQLALGERIRELGLRCALSTRDSLYVSGRMLDAGQLRGEWQLRRQAGFTCTWLSRRALRERYGVACNAALLTHGNLQLDPVALTGQLVASAADRGLRVHAPLEVGDVEASAQQVRLHTTSGVELRCRFAIFATGYEQPKFIRVPGRMVSTWALATVPQRSPNPAGGCLLWEAADPYLYLRTDARGRILCGGEDEPFTDAPARDALLTAKVRVLRRRLASLLPGVDTRVEQAWAATFGQSVDGLPTIAPVPGQRRCLVAMGYGGNGITFAMLAAQLVRAHVLGRPDPDSALFGFRSAPTSP